VADRFAGTFVKREVLQKSTIPLKNSLSRQSAECFEPSAALNSVELDRRGDDPGFTQALYLRLEEDFSPDDLFMDIEGHIRPGHDFVEVLTRQVAAADVLPVLIGPRWAELLAARTADPNDFVTIEIEAAPKQSKRVIPVLVGGAPMPRADSLPR
jgi:hypothetical protein